MIRYINKITILAFIIFFIGCAANNATKRVKTLINKKGETFTFHGDGTASVIGPFNEDLGIHRTNNNDPRKFDKVQLIKEDDKSAVYVGILGLKGGCCKCHEDNCKDPNNCKKNSSNKSSFHRANVKVDWGKGGKPNNCKKNSSNKSSFHRANVKVDWGKGGKPNNNNNNDNDDNNEEEEKEVLNVINNHMQKKHDWSKIPKPPFRITSQGRKTQMISMARVYKKLIYANIPDRGYCGGWWVLSYKNYRNNRNRCIKSPEQLGFGIISPAVSLMNYNTNIIKFVRDGSLKILSCVTKRGCYYIKIDVENISDKDIIIDFKAGQVFEQAREGIGQKQSLAIFKDYRKKIFDKEEMEKMDPGERFYLRAEQMVYFIKKGETKTIKLPKCGSLCLTTHSLKGLSK